RDGGNEVAVQKRRAGERQRLAADHRRFARVPQCRGERANLLGLVAEAAGDGARERIEDDILDALARALGNRVVAQARDKARELGGGRRRHSSFAPESFTAFAHLPSSDLTSAVNASGVEIAGSAARPIRRSRMSGMA